MCWWSLIAPLLKLQFVRINENGEYSLYSVSLFDGTVQVTELIFDPIWYSFFVQMWKFIACISNYFCLIERMGTILYLMRHGVLLLYTQEIILLPDEPFL